jgi:hypothetical protein
MLQDDSALEFKNVKKGYTILEKLNIIIHQT